MKSIGKKLSVLHNVSSVALKVSVILSSRQIYPVQLSPVAAPTAFGSTHFFTRLSKFQYRYCVYAQTVCAQDVFVRTDGFHATVRHCYDPSFGRTQWHSCLGHTPMHQSGLLQCDHFSTKCWSMSFRVPYTIHVDQHTENVASLMSLGKLQRIPWSPFQIPRKSCHFDPRRIRVFFAASCIRCSVRKRKIPAADVNLW